MKITKIISFLIITILPIISLGQNIKEREVLGEENARQAIKKALNDKSYKPFYDTLIKDKGIAIAVAESILFKIYGKKNIIKERPYESYLIDGFWYISGTLPKNYKGGVFEIIISAKDAHVKKLTHGK
jgi:NTF2 fold immunity protein of polymorphic toxin system component